MRCEAILVLPLPLLGTLAAGSPKGHWLQLGYT